VGGGRPLPQNRVGLFRDILNLHARHSAIMALQAPLYNRTVIGKSTKSAQLASPRPVRLRMRPGLVSSMPRDVPRPR
jgi:hypothetical protein